MTTPRFYIEALLWLHGTTSIHQHRFSGAFLMVAGESISTHYRFTETQRISGHLRLGQLVPVQPSTLLGKGSVTPIPAGSDFIHAVYHRVAPTITLVIRTAEDPEVGIQFSYTRTGIAMDPFGVDRRFETILKTLAFLKQVDEEQFVLRLFDWMSRAPLHEAARLLERYGPFLEEVDVLPHALGTIERRHGRRRAQALATVLAESMWTRSMQQQRAKSDQPYEQLCMDAALTCASIDDAVQLVSQRFPDRASDSQKWLSGQHAPPAWHVPQTH